jgi:hypothetical protein
VLHASVCHVPHATRDPGGGASCQRNRRRLPVGEVSFRVGRVRVPPAGGVAVRGAGVRQAAFGAAGPVVVRRAAVEAHFAERVKRVKVAERAGPAGVVCAARSADAGAGQVAVVNAPLRQAAVVGLAAATVVAELAKS